MPTITKKELVDKIAEKTGVAQSTVKPIVQQFLDEITKELTKSNRLEFRDFGIFEVKERAARTAQNPKTLEPVEIPAKRKVKFKMGRVMREGMNSKGAKKR
jgi:integration host factor subunit beta